MSPACAMLGKSPVPPAEPKIRGIGQDDDPWTIEGRLRVSDVWGQAVVSLDSATRSVEASLAQIAQAAGVREILLQLQVDRASSPYERRFTGIVTREGKIVCPMNAGELGLSTLLARRVGVGRRVRLMAWKKTNQATDDVEDETLLRAKLADAFATFMATARAGMTFSLREIVPRQMRSRMVMYRLRLMAREAVGRGHLQVHAKGRRRLYAKPAPKIDGSTAS